MKLSCMIWKLVIVLDLMKTNLNEIVKRVKIVCRAKEERVLKTEIKAKVLLRSIPKCQ